MSTAETGDSSSFRSSPAKVVRHSSKPARTSMAEIVLWTFPFTLHWPLYLNSSLQSAALAA